MNKRIKGFLMVILILAIIVTTWALTLQWYSQVYDHIVYEGNTYDFDQGFFYWADNGKLSAIKIDPDYTYRYYAETGEVEPYYLPLDREVLNWNIQKSK